MRSSTRTNVTSLLLLSIAILAGWWIAGLAHAGEPVPLSRGDRAHPIVQPVGAPAAGSGQSGDSGQIHDLDLQIKAMKDEFHGQLDPLQQQVKALRDKYEPQLKALEEKRHDLVEAGKPQAIQDLDRQETSELAALADREKAEHDRIRQQFAEERKDVQEKYKKLRAEASGGGRK
jgi:hypothetical protein